MMGPYDVISLVDVVEHIHPDEIEFFLSHVSEILTPGGLLVFHAPWDDNPLHFDHKERVEAWLELHFRKVGEFLWQRESDA